MKRSVAILVAGLTLVCSSVVTTASAPVDLPSTLSTEVRGALSQGGTSIRVIFQLKPSDKKVTFDELYLPQVDVVKAQTLHAKEEELRRSGKQNSPEYEALSSDVAELARKNEQAIDDARSRAIAHNKAAFEQPIKRFKHSAEKDNRVTVTSVIELLGMVAVEGEPKAVLELASLPDVDSVELNSELIAHAQMNNAYKGEKVDLAWSVAGVNRGSGRKIGILGPGATANQNNNLVASTNCTTQALSDIPHESRVVWAAASKHSTYTGPAPDSTQFYAKTHVWLGNGLSSTSSDLIACGIQWLVQQGVPIVAYSQSTDSDSAGSSFSTREWDKYIWDYSFIWAMPAGNNGPQSQTVSSEGGTYNTITVANTSHNNTASRSDDSLFINSSRGPTIDSRKKPDITAVGAWLTFPDGSTDGGTSYSTPELAGIAALVYNKLLNRGYPATDLTVKAALINTAELKDSDGNTTMPWDPGWGWGYVDAYKAVQSTPYILTGSLGQGGQNSYTFTANPGETVRLTVVTKRKAESSTFWGGPNLNISVNSPPGTYQMWYAASQNAEDNVEELEFVTPYAGTYTVIVNRATDNAYAYNYPYALASTKPLTSQ